MRFEEALIAMMKGAKIKRSIYETPIAYSSKRNKICFWVDETIGKDGTNYGCEVEFANADRVANDWAVVETEQDGDGDNMDKNEFEVKKFGLTDNINGEKTLDLSLKINTKAYDWLKDSEWFDKVQKKQIETMNDVVRERMPCSIKPIYDIKNLKEALSYSEWKETFIKECKPMESAERIEITFKSGETISYGKGEWDDYAYDGKAVIVKKNSAWIGIYNFDDVFCVELK